MEKNQESPDLDPTLKDLTEGAEALIFPEPPCPVDGTPTPFLSQNIPLVPTEMPPPNEPRRKPRKPMKRPKRFYHVPVASSVHTLPEVLLQQHAELLELINYDAFMDTSTTGRFGRWDTTLSIHNSANNSRGSKNSKNSGSSGKEKRRPDANDSSVNPDGEK